MLIYHSSSMGCDSVIACRSLVGPCKLKVNKTVSFAVNVDPEIQSRQGREIALDEVNTHSQISMIVSKYI